MHLYWLAIPLLPAVYCHNSVKGQLLAPAPLKPNLHANSQSEHHAALYPGTKRLCLRRFNRDDLKNRWPIWMSDGCSSEPSKQSSPLLCFPPQASWQNAQGMGPASAAKVQRLSSFRQR